jgi:hypothetical protein
MHYVEFEVITVVSVKSNIFLDEMPCSPVDVLPPSSGRRISQENKKAISRHIYLLLAGCLAYHSIMKMEALRSCERSGIFYRTALRHISNDGTLLSEVKLSLCLTI